MSIVQSIIQAAILGLGKSPVVVSGTPGSGNTLSAALRPGYTATGLQWYRVVSGVSQDISGQTGSTYQQTDADSGADLVGCRAIGLAFSASTGPVPVSASIVSRAVNGFAINSTSL